MRYVVRSVNGRTISPGRLSVGATMAAAWWVADTLWNHRDVSVFVPGVLSATVCERQARALADRLNVEHEAWMADHAA